MTGEAWAVVAGVLMTCLVQWALLSYYMGGVVERVRNHGTWLTSLDSRVSKTELRVGRIEGRIRLKVEVDEEE